MEKKIVVPEGMIEAAVRGLGIRDGYERYCNHHRDLAQAALVSALRWLSENPIEPTPEQAHDLVSNMMTDTIQFIACAWQRRMFLQQSEPIPESVKDIVAWFEVYLGSHPEYENIKRNLLLAHQRGKESR